MFGNPKGEMCICHSCKRKHDILRGTKCVCACGTSIKSKEYVEMKTEEVAIMTIYDNDDGVISVDHPENNTIPLFKLIGFLEVYMMQLKEHGINILESDEKK